jgi:Secretion system C-terminal sorting domain/Fibronectin type III domain
MRKNYFLTLFLLMTAFWNVEATDGSKSTNPAQNSETTFLLPPGNPSSLGGVAVGGSGTRINLFWNDNSSDETLFEIAYSTLPSGYQTRTIISNLGAVAGYQMQGLQPLTTYYFSVRALKTFDGTTPTCVVGSTTPTNAVPAGKTASCWSNVVMVSTNALIPDAASDVVVFPFAQRTATVNFMDNSTNETGFEIWRSIGGGDGNFEKLASTPGFVGTGRRSYVDNSVLPNIVYKYRVKVFNATGYASFAPTSSAFRTLNDPPTAPHDLTQFAPSLNSASFYWLEDSQFVDGFEVEQSADGYSWFVIDNLPANLNFVTRNGLSEGVKYYFRVRAKNEGGYSPYSSPVYSITTLKRVAPLAPFNLRANTISQTQVDLVWNNNIEDGITNVRVSQEIYRSSVSKTDGFEQIAILDPYFATYSDKTAKPKTKYWYKVLSANYQGQSDFTNIAVATTLGPPFAPSDLTTALANDALGNTVIKATWKDNSNDEWSFSLERALDGSFTKEVLKADLDSNTVSATSIPIEEGVTYYYRVKASNIYGDSKYSDVSTISTIVTTAPNAPYELKGTATATEVALKWGDDSNKEDAFEIERSTDGTTFAKVGSTPRNAVTYSDNSIIEKTKYFYRVLATNVIGNSDYSNVVEVTTLAKTSASVDLGSSETFLIAYPNPTSDAVKITLPDNLKKETGVITITDRMNREVSKTILTPNQSEYSLDMSNFSEGTYTISLRTTTQQITKRVYKY